MAPARFELASFGLAGRCSFHLSYGAIHPNHIPIDGFPCYTNRDNPMYCSSLSIEDLERDLKYGEGELEKAKAIVAQWTADVTSQRILIEARRKRLGSTQRVPNGIPEDVAPAVDDWDYLPPKEAPKAEHVSHVDWIYNAVVASGERGMSPPEILKTSAQAGLAMHKNYPYVVLRGLVDKHKVTKREGRYYAA